MGWSRKSSREGRAHRRPDLESLEVRQLLSLTEPVPASTPRLGALVRTDGSVDYDEVIQASVARATFKVNGAGANVAVIDTGVAATNPAFGTGSVGQAGNRIVAGVDFTTSPHGVIPTWQHGTGVAGLIGSNDAENPGVAPGAGIVALRVFGDDNQGSFDRIAQALDWVVQNHDEYQITAVNLSVADGGNYQANLFGNDGSVGQAITTAVKTLTAANIPVVVAAGNNFDGKTQGQGFAAIIPETISVTATDETRSAPGQAGAPLARDAQRLGAAKGGESATDLAAPGVGLIAASGSAGTATEDGTSFATPQVTGTVLLLQEMYREAYGRLPTVSQLDGWLDAGAEKVHDSATGINIGRLNVANSLQVLDTQIQAASRKTLAAQVLESGPVAAPVVTPPVVLVAPAPVIQAAPIPVAPPVVAPPPPAPPVVVVAPPPVETGTTVAAPMTEVIINGASVGHVATARLAEKYARLFALTKGVARNLRAWIPAGSTVDLGAVKPSGRAIASKSVAVRTRARASERTATTVVARPHPTRSFRRVARPGGSTAASPRLILADRAAGAFLDRGRPTMMAVE